MITPNHPQAIALFFSYAHKDQDLRDKLAAHLKLLERRGVIASWHDREILPGTEWKGQIHHHLETAQIVLMLISSDFLASDYCYDIEMKRALERHQAGEARVIPILLRPIDNWSGSPFGHLQCLPINERAVTQWSNQDEAFAEVARGIRLAVEAWQRGDCTPLSQAQGEAIAPDPSSSQPSPSGSTSMEQTNTGSSTGWQVNVSGGMVNITPPGQH